MADTVQKQIIDEIVARINNITVANGYSFDLKTVTKFKGTPWRNGDMPQADVFTMECTATENQYNIDSYIMPVTVQMWTNNTDKKIPYEVSMSMSADLIIALNRATSAPLVTDLRSKDLGGLVDKVSTPESLYLTSAEQSSWAGIAFAFDVEFSTLKSDPFTLKTI